MSAVLENGLARLLCSTPATPCAGCITAARLVLANPIPVVRFLSARVQAGKG